MFASHTWPRWGNDAHPGGHAHAARHLRQPEQRRAAPRQPGRDDQRDPQRLPACRRACSRTVGGAQLPRLRRAQQPRRHQSLPRLLGRQPGHADPAVAARLRSAVRRDDGRARPRSSPRAASSTTQGKYRSPSEILNKLVYAEPGEPGGQGPAGRRLRADRLPEGEPEPAQQLPRRPRSNCARGSRAGDRRKSTGPDTDPRHVDGLWLDFLGIRLDSSKADGLAVHDQPGDARQRRAVRRRAEQFDADQHQGIPGEEPGPHASRSTAPTSSRS